MAHEPSGGSPRWIIHFSKVHPLLGIGIILPDDLEENLL